MSHTVYALTISPGQKWGQKILGINFHAANEKAQHAIIRGPVFFLLGAG